MKSPLDVLYYHKLVFIYFGMFEVKDGSASTKLWLNVHTICYQILFTDLGLILFSLSILESPSSKHMLQSMFVVICYVNAAFKAFSFYIKRDTMQALWSRLEDTVFMAKDGIEQKLAEKSANYDIRKVINYYSWFGALNLMYAYVAPIIERTKRLPYIMYVPFAIDETKIGFYLAYLYQLGNVVYAGGINIAVNMYLFDVFVCVKTYLSLLSSRLSRLGYPSGYNETHTATPTTRLSFYREMCRNIEMHIKIHKFVEETNALVNDLIFVQVSQAAFVLANSAILLLTYDLTFTEFTVPMIWLSTFLAEMAIYCYFGNNIMYTFEGIHENIYRSNFIAFDQKTNVALLKMMSVTGGRSMKIFTVGLVRFELTLHTLLMILKTTYSLVMLVKSM